MTDKIDMRGAMTRDNFREVAKAAVAKYRATGKVFDELFWSTVIAFYDGVIEDAKMAATVPEAVVLDDAAADKLALLLGGGAGDPL